MAGFWRKYVSLVALVLLLGAGGVWAADTADASAASAPVVPPDPDKTVLGTGVADIMPRLSELKKNAALEHEKIEGLKDISRFTEQILEAKQEQEAIEQQAVELAKSGWADVDRLTLFQETVNQHNKALKKLESDISANLSALETIRNDWTGRKEFWERWIKTSEIESVKGNYADAFGEVNRTIASILEKIETIYKSYATIQKLVANLLEKNNAHLRLAEKSLEDKRGRLLDRKVSLFHKNFYASLCDTSLLAQFRRDMIPSFRQVDVGGTKIPSRLILGAQLLLALMIGLVILFKREKLAEMEEWRFIWEHPWATGCFSAIGLLSFLYTGLLPIWRLIQWQVMGFSASAMLSSFLRDRYKILMVLSLSTFFVLTIILRVSSFPEPFFRLYLAAVALSAVIAFFLFLFYRARREPEHQWDGFSWLLRIGILLASISFVAQCIGYDVLAVVLLLTPIVSLFTVLFAFLGIKLVDGGLTFLFAHFPLPKTMFFESLRRDLNERFHFLSHVVIIGFAILYILRGWMGKHTVADAWAALLHVSFTVASIRVSVKKALLMILFIYLSYTISKWMQLFLDRELFPQRKMERGMRDLIKKMVHYGLVTFGFLWAMSILGIDLKNFAVLAGAVSIGIGFGLQNIVNNFVSGLILLFERPITVGDIVVLQGQWGTVRRIGLRSTIVESLDRSEIVVPNSQLVSEPFVNWTLSNSTARCSITVGVAYGTDVARVIKILEEIGRNHPEVLASPPPLAKFTGFGDSALDFELRVWIANVSHVHLVKSDLGRAIAARFEREEIEIPFPQQDLNVRVAGENKAAPELLAALAPAPSQKEPDPEKEAEPDTDSEP